MSQRYHLPPGGDVPIETAARRMAMTVQEFRLALDELVLSRAFPAPDPTTGKFDLDAIDAWRRRRHPQLFPQDAQSRLLLGPTARHAGEVTRERLRKVPGG